MLLAKKNESTIVKVTIDQRKEWEHFVTNSAEHDLYHTWHYHSLEKTEEPILFVYENGTTFIALPLLRRQIAGCNSFDLHSVYGFTGPISNQPLSDLSDDLILKFKWSFLNYLKEEKYVSIFSGLNPFFDQTKIINNFGGLFENGKVVAIDLHLSIDDQRKKYRVTTFDAVKKCQRRGFTVKEHTTRDEIGLFSSLYQANMKRVDATDFYLFSEEHLEELLNPSGYQCKLYLAYDNDVLICGTIVMFAKNVMHGHLMASNKDYLKLSPAKFLIDELSILARTLGITYYNLGGGLGFKENSLLTWKLGFSDKIFEYNSWRYIIDYEKYDFLVQQTTDESDELADYFPLYRLATQNSITN